YGPHQNGKIESFWGTVESRLMAQLEGVEALTLKMLNDATVAWLEQDYHRRAHRELGMTPHERLAGSVDASRPCLGAAELKAAFRITRKRTLRRSDGTVSVEAVRYQVPQPWRHLREVWVRYARWDLGSVDLVDGRSGERLCTLYPLDKRGNADGVRRPAGPGDDDGKGGAAAGELPPLLTGLLDAQAATGLPPAWLPHDETPGPGDDDDRGETS
ncbi:MAG: IS481 family transposase, partial [Chloroflexi bacterium]|nr:IS481 family transposase [Chloroflexota bacterium]